MNNSPKLFIIISNLDISIITGYDDNQNSFKLLEKLILPNQDIIKNRITNLEKITNLIKKNILIIEEKVGYTFKNIIVILDNFEISFLNLSGYKKLNGSQISKENIFYILNSLKSCVDEFEKNKKILHIFNSEYRLDKDKIDNLPIGLFGNFYSHGLSFNLINNNHYNNLENIFKNCNLKVKKYFIQSYLEGSFLSNKDTLIKSFFYIQVQKFNCKVFLFENDVLKFEQRFNFGSDIVYKDISKVTSLNIEMIKKFMNNNKSDSKISSSEIIEKEYFNDQIYRRIKKELIFKIAEARIKELGGLILTKNINFHNSINKINKIFLEISDKQQLESLSELYKNYFSNGNKSDLDIIDKTDCAKIIETAYSISQFGWKNEVIPVTNNPKSLISKIFKALFH